MDRNVNVITDPDGNKFVVVNDIIFKGKRNVNWKDVEEYLRQYVGEFYEIVDTKEIVYIGSDLPDEYLMLMRHAKDDRIYLYDIMEIKKETSNLFQSDDLTQ